MAKILACAGGAGPGVPHIPQKPWGLPPLAAMNSSELSKKRATSTGLYGSVTSRTTIPSQYHEM